MPRRGDWERDEHDRDGERGGYPGDGGRTMDGDWYRQAYPPRPDDAWPRRWNPERREPEEWMRFNSEARFRQPSGWDQGRGDWPVPERGGEPWPLGRRGRDPETGPLPRAGSGYAREDFGGYGREGERSSLRPDWGGEDRRGGGAESFGYGRGMTGPSGRRGGFAGKGPKNYHRPDDLIREELNGRLTEHPGVDASEIDVQVKDGEVTLLGSVDDRRAKRLAEDIAEQTFGVRDVRNQLRVVSRARP